MQGLGILVSGSAPSAQEANKISQNSIEAHWRKIAPWNFGNSCRFVIQVSGKSTNAEYLHTKT